MPMIKIANGEAHVKEMCTRKIKKEINKVLLDGIEANVDGNIKGINIERIDKANDLALTLMVEKVVIDGKEREITPELFDEMDARDVDKIIRAINVFTGTEALGNE